MKTKNRPNTNRKCWVFVPAVSGHMVCCMKEVKPSFQNFWHMSQMKNSAWSENATNFRNLQIKSMQYHYQSKAFVARFEQGSISLSFKRNLISPEQVLKFLSLYFALWNTVCQGCCIRYLFQFVSGGSRSSHLFRTNNGVWYMVCT